MHSVLITLNSLYNKLLLLATCYSAVDCLQTSTLLVLANYIMTMLRWALRHRLLKFTVLYPSNL